jgi:PhzF family phenazine biosynthesis protein
MTTQILRYSAFTTDPDGGNPAGVVLDAAGLDDGEMLRIAADVGYSETAFLQKAAGGDLDVRYFSPMAEVPFCGHATIAAAVALAERGAGPQLVFNTRSGTVPVTTGRDADGRPVATLTSVEPRVVAADPTAVAAALAALRWEPTDLDAALPPRVAYAGAHHLVLAAASRERLAKLDYDFDRLQRLMLAQDWTTLALVWRETATLFHARNPFPVGGVVEDPATGAAAAAFGAYLRELQLVDLPAAVTIHQGDDMGRPSRLRVDITDDDPRIRVTGSAVVLP